MTAFAHLTYDGGGSIFPADSAYDRETLHEHLLHVVGRRGRLRLELDGRAWWLSAETAPLDCADCHRRLRVAARIAGDPARCVGCVLCASALKPTRRGAAA